MARRMVQRPSSSRRCRFFLFFGVRRASRWRAKHDVFRRCLNDTLLVQLQSEWTNDETIPNMAQKVRDKG